MQTIRHPALRLFATAPEAEPHRVSSRLVSLILHAATVSALVLVNVGTHVRTPEERVEQVTFLDVRQAPPTPPAEPPRAFQVTTPKGFQTLTAPASIPDLVPPAESTATNEADYSGENTEGGTAAGTPAAPPPAEAPTYELSEVSVAPQMTRVVKPEYPRELAWIHGTVLIRVDLLPTGDPDRASVKVVKPLNPILDDAAVQALLKTRFSPGYAAGRPVRVAVLVPYLFTSK